MHNKSPRKRAGTLPATFNSNNIQTGRGYFFKMAENLNANTGCNGRRFVTQLPFSHRFPVSRELSNKPVSG